MLKIRNYGQMPYLEIWQQMKQFTVQRNGATPDEIWLLEHPPVYTQGQAGKEEHVLNPANIPVVQSDRGGQVTFHGPGQLVVYFMMDLRRRNIGIRTLVRQLESLLMALLSEYGIKAQTLCGAPGVYIQDEKIASIGLRVKNGCTYHGIALNIDMDLTPFNGINPCGFAKLKMTQIKNLNTNVSVNEVRDKMISYCLNYYNTI